MIGGSCVFSGSRHCLRSGCSGFITASLETRRKARSGESVTVKCNSCSGIYCWTCHSLYHVGTTCVEAANVQNEWMTFLKIVQHGEAKSKKGAANLLLRLEQRAADASYFRRNVENGHLKKCPRCRRLIEKMTGCNRMVRSGVYIYISGHHIIDCWWTLLPLNVTFACYVCRYAAKMLAVGTARVAAAIPSGGTTCLPAT